MIALGFLVFDFLPDGFNSIVSAASMDNKFEIFNLGFSGGFSEFFAKPYTLLAGVLGGGFSPAFRGW